MLHYLLLALATTTLTVTFTRSSLFQPLRVWIKARSEFVGRLISCTYCFSHWAAAAVVLYFTPPYALKAFLLDWLVTIALATIGIRFVYDSARRMPAAAEDRDHA